MSKKRCFCCKGTPVVDYFLVADSKVPMPRCDNCRNSHIFQNRVAACVCLFTCLIYVYLKFYPM